MEEHNRDYDLIGRMLREVNVIFISPDKGGKELLNEEEKEQRSLRSARSK